MFHRFFLRLCLVVFCCTLWSPEAISEIYKYTDKNGNVVYTDSLSALPSKRRAYYAKKKREREQRRQALERRVGKDELERREAEKKLEALRQKKVSEREYAAQKAALDARLRDFDQRRNARKKKVQSWQSKMDKLRAQLKEKLSEFVRVRKEADQAAFRYSSTAMLIHAQNRDKAIKRLSLLEKEIDALAHQIKVEIPAKALKAGVRVR